MLRSTNSTGIESKRQPCAEPCMVRSLEDRMQAMAEQGDQTWMSLLGSWLITFGVVRLDHIRRTANFLQFFCHRGEQKHRRVGFYWGAPTHTTSGWCWAEQYL